MKGFSGFKNVAKTGYAGSSAFQQKKGGPSKSKEELLAEGFTPADADQMIKHGATTGKPKTKKPSQGDFKPAYEGADYSKKDIAKMSEKEKQSKIDGYTPKKAKKAKKSTTSAHGQLSDAEEEYKQDLKILAKGLGKFPKIIPPMKSPKRRKPKKK